MKSNIFITGFSGSGKTSVGRLAARRLNWRFVDIDEQIAQASGKTIEAIFGEEGEPGFRQLESETLDGVCRDERQVVSTGGGIVMSERNRTLMDRSGIVICLEARPPTLRRRLESERFAAAEPVVRPVLADRDLQERIIALKSERQAHYALAQWTVHTDHLTPDEVAEEVVRAWRVLSRRSETGASSKEKDLAATVVTSSGDYPVWVGWGTLSELGDRVRRILSPGAAYLITDRHVEDHASRARASLEAAGVPSHTFVIPPGERSKSLETVQRIYTWLVGLKAERGHLLLAVGGGVVGDLAGFVAATFLRGVPFGQVPTSLLAMMDASIGGKTAVDLAQGKNLVGAFYQPRFVLADVQTLQTLPERELTSGWAEAIKHGLIMDEELLRSFEERRDAIFSLDRESSTEMVRRSAAIKADVVARDERETLGIRVLLNYGHTIGHAIEAATGYRRFLHGEAISVGMMGAAMISNELGMLPGEEVERQRALLVAYGLPVSSKDIDVAAIEEAISLDKKRVSGAVSWVLLKRIGQAVTRSDVPADVVTRALNSLGR